MSAIEKSQCLLFVVSPSLLANEWCEYAFQHAVAERYRNMVFIIYREIPPKTWTDHMEPLKRAINVAKHKVTWPGAHKSKGKSIKLCLSLECTGCENTDHMCYGSKCTIDGRRGEQNAQTLIDIDHNVKDEMKEFKNESEKDGQNVENEDVNCNIQIEKPKEILPRKDNVQTRCQIIFRRCFTLIGKNSKEEKIEKFWKQLRVALPPKLSPTNKYKPKKKHHIFQNQLSNSSQKALL